jgi:hypothetical protein
MWFFKKKSKEIKLPYHFGMATFLDYKRIDWKTETNQFGQTISCVITVQQTFSETDLFMLAIEFYKWYLNWVAKSNNK